MVCLFKENQDILKIYTEDKAMLCDMSSDITERSLKESKIYLIIALIPVVLSKLRLLAGWLSWISREMLYQWLLHHTTNYLKLPLLPQDFFLYITWEQQAKSFSFTSVLESDDQFELRIIIKLRRDGSWCFVLAADVLSGNLREHVVERFSANRGIVMATECFVTPPPDSS